MSLAARLEDRVSPLVVKELRQALRGRYFAISFWATLVFAMGLTILRLAGFQLGSRSLWGDDTNDGRGIFSVLYFCLAWAVGAVVPFSAFLSMGAEWEEGTFDLLVLSNLRPRQIFLGKLLSAAIQCALTMSAIVPFMAFAFLLGGIDLLLLAIMLTLLVFYSLAASAFAIALSTLARARYARLMLRDHPRHRGLPQDDLPPQRHIPVRRVPWERPGEAFWFAQALLLFALSAIGLMSFAIGASRLAHSEENQLEHGSAGHVRHDRRRARVPDCGELSPGAHLRAADIVGVRLPLPSPSSASSGYSW